MNTCLQKFFLIAVMVAAMNMEDLQAQSDSSRIIITKRFLSVEDGLASREVLCGLQDSYGFIWFGTRNGLNRFDGKNFLLFSKEKRKLQQNRVIQLTEDDAKQLWILYGQTANLRSSDFKVDIMDLVTHQLVQFDTKFPNAPFKQKDINWIGSNDANEIMFITNPINLYSWSSKAGFKKIMTSNEGFNRFTIRHIFHPDNNWIYLVSNAHILVQNGIATPVQLGESDELSPLSINADGSFDVTYFGKSKRFEFIKMSSSGKITPHNFQENENMHNFVKYCSVHDQHYDFKSNTSVLFSTVTGFDLWENHSLTKLLSAEQLKNYPQFKSYSYFTDLQRRKWICTSAGVFMLKTERNKFKHYFSYDDVQLTGNFDNQARGIYADAAGNVYGAIWFKLYRSAFDKKDKPEEINIDKGIIYPLLADDENLWIGHYGLEKYNFKTHETEVFPVAETPTAVWALFRPDSNRVLVTYFNKILNFHINENKFSECASNRNYDFGTLYRFIRSTDGKIWGCGHTGVYELDDDGCILNRFSSEDSSHHIPVTDILDIYEDKNGIFWLATNGSGLVKWNRSDNRFTQYTIADGLSSNLIYCILQDERGYLWLSSDYGLMRFDTADATIKTYTTANGISHNEFNRISKFKALDGRMFFGGLNGVSAFYPKDFWGDSASINIPLRITSFTKFSSDENKLLNLTSELLQQNKITMFPGDRFFNLDFNLLDFEEKQHRYGYMIEGLDKEWMYSTENSIRISGLPYGNYMLLIKGQNMDGQWSASELKIPLKVLTPFYLKWWFVIITVAFLIMIVFFFSRWRTRQLMKTKTALEKTVSERTEQLKISLGEKEVLLKEIHHRVKNNLQVIVSLLDMQQKKIDSPVLQQSFTEAKTNVRSISLIHENLYRNENLSGVDVNSFVNDLVKQVSTVFNTAKKQIDFICNIDPMQLDIDTTVPLGLILNELLTNSFKYAFNKVERMKISVAIHKTGDESFELVYTDNGPGLPEDFDLKKTKTMGINLVKDLSRQIGGHMNYKYENGSCFTIKFLSVKGRKKVD